MVKAMFQGDVFLPKENSIQVKVKIRSKDLQADIHALLDSGATENFISQIVVNRFKLPRIKLPKVKYVRNMDGTRNSIGAITHAVYLEMKYNDAKLHARAQTLPFYIINMGTDNMILGYTFLAATNPRIDWKNRMFHGHVTVSTQDAHLWTRTRQQCNLDNITIAEQNDNESPDLDFIPKNQRGYITLPPYMARRTTMATQLAVKAMDKNARTWQEQVPVQYHKFGKVFSEEEAQRFPQDRPWNHAIDLLPEAPNTLDCKIYPLAPGEQEALDKFLKEHLDKGYIRPSKSPYASPFFFIKKKDGKLRPVQDYRALNKWTVRNKYPLPLIKELIVNLVHKKWFTKFDIRWGYNNIRIKNGDQWKAAFKTNKGLYEPMVMFFGLTNSPATFQTMMDQLFREEIATNNVFIYMDDILIATDGKLNRHEQIVAKVLKKLMDNDLYLKPEKCSFHKQEVDYLGVIVGKGEVKMDPVKVKGIKDWPKPTKLKELRSFLGFGNYYKDFIPAYSHMTRPLHDLTRKDKKWAWTDVQQKAFDLLKTVFITYPVLRNPDQRDKFILDTDASAFAVGAVLSQDFKKGIIFKNTHRHPVAYFSHSLTETERNYEIYDRELLAIIMALKAFRYMLLGAKHKILIRSDHNNLKYFKETRKITPRQARWIEFLADYDFELEHLPGYTNTVADLLSRNPDHEKGVKIADSIAILPDHLWKTLANAGRAPEPLNFEIRAKGAKTNHKEYLEEDDTLRRNVLKEIHDTPVGGHPGISNTWHLVDRNYYGPRLRKFVESYVKGCAKCQESKVITTQKRAPLQPFDTHVKEGPFQYVSMDLITDLPKSGRYDAILTIVDQGCSKAAKFIPCNKTIDGEGVATLYFKHLFPWFGIPKRIISDRDPRFTSHFSKAICKATNIQQNISTAFHPRTDGQTERMNQWIETYLRGFVNGRQNNWSALLPIAEFAHNSWKHEGTKYAPHMLITGHIPSAKLMPLDDSTPAAHIRLSELSKARSDAQNTLNKRISHSRTPRELRINQKVWLDGRNLKVKLPSKKLAPRRYGPFDVIDKVSPVAYRIKLPETMKIHNVFHLDLLTPYHETQEHGANYTQPPPELIDGEEEYEVEDIISDRKHGRTRKLQYLIKWKGYPQSENSWVDAKNLHSPELLRQYRSAQSGSQTYK